MTPDELANALRGLGYVQLTNGADGDATIWQDPQGNKTTQGALAADPTIVGVTKNAPGNVTAANLPGLIFQDDGKGGGGYIHQDGTPATNAEVQAAAAASRTSSSSNSSTTLNLTPQRVSQTEMGADGRTYTVIRDAVTGAEVSRTLSGFAPLSPQEQFQQDLQKAAAGDAAAMARVQAQNATSIANTQSNNQTSIANQTASDAAALERQQSQTAGNAAISAGNDTEANRRALLTEQQQNARAGLNAQVQGFQSVNTLAPQLAAAALNNAQFTSDQLSKPADFLARAYFTRGQTSPLPQVSQADIINQLTNNIAGYQGALNGFNQNFGGFNAALPNVANVAPAVTPTVGFNSRGSIPGATSVTGSGAVSFVPGVGYVDANGRSVGGATGTNPGNPGSATVSTAPVSGGNVGDNSPGTLGVPAGGNLTVDKNGNAVGFAKGTGGGFTTTPVARVGDDPSGMPNSTEETLLNPTHAPIGIVPNPATAGGASGAAPAAPKADPAEAAIIKAIGFVPTKIQHELVDELAKLKGAKQPPRFAFGTGADGSMGFSAPTLPTQGLTTQAALQALEASTRPPAISSILAGGAPNDLQLGFATPTKMSYGDLTPDEKTAFGTTLATQYNLAPSDVETAINQRYSTGSRGKAGTAGF